MKKGKITSLLLAATVTLTPATSLAHGSRTEQPPETLKLNRTIKY